MLSWTFILFVFVMHPGMWTFLDSTSHAEFQLASGLLQELVQELHGQIQAWKLNGSEETHWGNLVYKLHIKRLTRQCGMACTGLRDSSGKSGGQAVTRASLGVCLQFLGAFIVTDNVESYQKFFLQLLTWSCNFCNSESIYTMHFINLFTYIAPLVYYRSLHLWNKANLIIVNDPFEIS